MPIPARISGKLRGEDTVASSHGGDYTTSRVPNAKKPKARPRSLRDTVLFPVRSLPQYTGPYHVGTMEIEVPARNPRTFSHIKRHGRHLLHLETVLMTIYYPAAGRPTGSSSRELWLGRPRLGMTAGFGHFGGIGPLGVLFFLPTMFTKLPAWRNAPLSDARPVNQKASKDGSKNAHAEKGSEGNSKPPQFPLLVFSHGLGGTRTMYSSVCGEFASYGFVVCAVEHRDGSGPRTYVNTPPGRECTVEDEKEDCVKEKGPVRKKKGYHKVDYIFPQDNPWDTRPGKDVDRELRDAQIDLRMAEMEEAYQVLCKINEGRGEEVARDNLRKKGFKGASSHGLEGIDWSTWIGRLRLGRVTALGHSFGAATVIEMLRHHDRFKWVTQGIIYDIWGAGTRSPEHVDPKNRNHGPLLAIDSEAFTYWPENFDFVRSVVEEAKEASPAWLLTVRGTVHLSQSDFSIVYPHITSIFLKATANPQRALDLNINASLEFLKAVRPQMPSEFTNAFPDEQILNQPAATLDDIPISQLHRPKEKFTASRLRIQHEWLYRMLPPLAKRVAVKKARKEGVDAHKEVWVHSKPTEDQIQQFRERLAEDDLIPERNEIVAGSGMERTSGEKTAGGRTGAGPESWEDAAGQDDERKERAQEHHEKEDNWGDCDREKKTNAEAESG